MFYRPAEWLTHRHGSHRHGGRRPAIHDFSVGNEEKSWMPTCVGKTMRASAVRQALGGLVFLVSVIKIPGL
jgi:hypothetical protein